jgi:hypothetical protein
MHPTAPVQRKCKCFSNGTMDRRPKPYQSTPKTCSHFELAHSFRHFTACCMQANYDYAVNDRTTDTMSPQQASLARRELNGVRQMCFRTGMILTDGPLPASSTLTAQDPRRQLTTHESPGRLSIGGVDILRQNYF